MVCVSVEVTGPSVVGSVAPERRRGRPMSRGWRRVAAGGSALLFCSAAGSLLIMEAKTSTLQAEVFSHMAAQMSYRVDRSEEHTSELQSLMRISYAVFCLKT